MGQQISIGTIGARIAMSRIARKSDWSVGIALAGLLFVGSAGRASGPADPPVKDSANGTVKMAGVDGLISHLHQEFQITAAQEALFRRLADVMREDASSMSALAKKRAEGASSMTAVDDLKSYAAISQAHAEDTRKMIPVFEALYESMSVAQKKAADEEFRTHYAPMHGQKR